MKRKKAKKKITKQIGRWGGQLPWEELHGAGRQMDHQDEAKVHAKAGCESAGATPSPGQRKQRSLSRESKQIQHWPARLFSFLSLSTGPAKANQRKLSPCSDVGMVVVVIMVELNRLFVVMIVSKGCKGVNY